MGETYKAHSLPPAAQGTSAHDFVDVGALQPTRLGFGSESTLPVLGGVEISVIYISTVSYLCLSLAHIPDDQDRGMIILRGRPFRGVTNERSTGTGLAV